MWSTSWPLVRCTVGEVGILDDLDSTVPVDCPRCHRTADQQFYGPCERCLSELRSVYQADAGATVDVAYEPKMHVTPNAVALKDD